MVFFHTHHNSSIMFDHPEEGGDGLNDMIAAEQEDRIDIFDPETGEKLAAYLDQALVMGSNALSNSREREA